MTKILVNSYGQKILSMREMGGDVCSYCEVGSMEDGTVVDFCVANDADCMKAYNKYLDDMHIESAIEIDIPQDDEEVF